LWCRVRLEFEKKNFTTRPFLFEQHVSHTTLRCIPQVELLRAKAKRAVMETREVPSLKHCCFRELLRGCTSDFSDISTAHFPLTHIISNVMNEDLQLSFFQYCVVQQRMNDQLFQIFKEKCPNIKYQTHLSLKSCNVADITLEIIQNNFTNLKIFDLSGCARITQAGFSCLPGMNTPLL
jgi:hypothetical protein